MAGLTGMHGPAWRGQAPRGAVALAVIALSALLLLSGCAPGGSEPPTSPSVTVLTEAELSASPTPTLSYDPEHLTDEQAVEIAVDVFNRYFAALAQMKNAGADIDGDLANLSTGRIEESLSQTISDSQSHTYHIEGVPTLRNSRLEANEGIDGWRQISIISCLDLSNVNSIVDGKSAFETGELKKNTLTFVVNNSEGTFKAEAVTSWDGESIC